MKPLTGIIALTLLAVTAPCQPSQVSAPGSRCTQVTRLARMTKTAEACSLQMTPGSFATRQEASRAADELLDRHRLDAAELFRRTAETADALSPLERFYSLPDLAKVAFNLGHPEQALAYARELLQAAPQYRDDWNYGNAVYFGNSMLGRVALQQGNLQLARQYLLESSSTPGSPQLGSFGPNVSLAKDLLEKGDSAVVLEFLDKCRSFWKLGGSKLDSWSDAIRRGAMPEFGPNLAY